jgi:oxygen-independent coproporphyrinogen-3 oxidase
LLGRQHVPSDIEETVSLLRQYDFKNLNIDLMFALPSQPEKVWKHTLEAALACSPDHISAYALTYEEDTPFFREKWAGRFKVDEEREIRMFESTVEILSAAGLPPYEISNFAKVGFESRHNQAYWQGSDYLGLGPSAVSTIGNKRWKNIADTRLYIERIQKGESLQTEEEDITPEVKQKERIMLGLRTRRGVPVSQIDPSLRNRLLEERLAQEDKGYFKLTQRGRLTADGIAVLFI